MLDFGGGTFAPLTGLPHVAGVGTRSEPDVVRRIVAEVQGVVDRREAYFRAQGIDSIETYRTRRAEGRADDGYGDVFLVVDGWSTLRADFDDLELELQAAGPARPHLRPAPASSGAARWADFRAAMRDVFGTRLELRLGDPIDSEIDRKVAQLVPTGRPGRGIMVGKLHFLGALPRIDGLAGPVEPRRRRRGPRQAQRRRLDRPARPEAAAAARADRARRPSASRPRPPAIDDERLLLGINEKELAPVGLDPASEPHLLVLGDGQSGKSALLRTYRPARSSARRPPRRRRSSSSTTGGRCSARSPRTTCSTT